MGRLTLQPSRSVAPMPIMAPSSIVAACMLTPCPTVTLSPIFVLTSVSAKELCRRKMKTQGEDAR